MPSHQFVTYTRNQQLQIPNSLGGGAGTFANYAPRPFLPCQFRQIGYGFYQQPCPPQEIFKVAGLGFWRGRIIGPHLYEDTIWLVGKIFSNALLLFRFIALDLLWQMVRWASD